MVNFPGEYDNSIKGIYMCIRLIYKISAICNDYTGSIVLLHALGNYATHTCTVVDKASYH